MNHLLKTHLTPGSQPMLKVPKDFSKARVLVTNDDGIHAEGLDVLADVANEMFGETWVCAPLSEQSGAGHSLTLHRPLRIKHYEERHHSVDGTPTDCVLVAIGSIMKDNRPDMVLSGINYGDNSGDNVTYSGTIAAAFEGTMLGVPSVAFSQERNYELDTVNWDIARKWIPGIMQRLASMKWPADVLMNVNFPDREPEAIKGIRVVPHGRRLPGENLDERVDPRGRSYLWIGDGRSIGDKPTPGSDLEVLAKGYISITPLCLNLTHAPTLKELEKVFS